MILFLAASLFPAALIVAAAYLGGIWPYLAFLGGVPCALVLDTAALKPPKEQEARRAVTWITGFLGLAHLALMPVIVYGLVQLVPDRWPAALALWLAAGNYFGHVANPNAHELIHMSGRGSRRLGALIYSALLFGHHTSAHRLVHHVHVASEGDPNSARAGENFYAFWPRAWIGSFVAGLRAVNAQRARAATPRRFWTHPYLGYALGGLAALGAAFAVAGWPGVAAWALVCFYAQEQLLMADYVQHYGLRRARLADGSLEPVSARHSWNSPHVYSSAMTLNAPRHSDHHLNPRRSFPSLRIDREAMPVLPASLPAMGFIGLIPPLWRWTMDPLLEDWTSAAGPRHVPAKAALVRARSHGPAPRDLPRSVHASRGADSPDLPDVAGDGTG